MWSGSRPNCESASRNEIPALSFTPSTLSSNVAATARLPNSVDANRTPSSSANPVTSIANGNRRSQPERTVPFAGVADGVVMRAQHQARRARNLAFVAAADVSDRVEMRAHSGVAHPAQDEVGGRAMLVGEEDAREMFWRFGDRRQFVDPADDLIAERRVLWPGAW